MSEANRDAYKKTKLGWIPEDWNVSSFWEISKRRKSKLNPNNNNPSYKCIELEHLESDTGRVIGFVESESQKSIKNVFKENDILFGKLRPYLKKYWHATFNGVCSSEIWVLKNQRGVSPKYLYYLIQTNRFISATNVSTGTKMPRADWNFLSGVLFPLPSLLEQKKIAEILSTWDRAIETLEQLIAQKVELKRGLMQQLLSGKTRIPGFEGKWEERKIGELFKFLRSIAASRSELVDQKDKNDVLNLHYGDLHVKYNSQTLLDVSNDTTIPAISSAFKHSAQIDEAKDGDVVIVDASEDYDGVGECIELVNIGDKILTAGLHTFLLRDQKASMVDGFRSLIFDQPSVKKQLKRIVTGSNVYGLSKTNLAKVEVKLPSKKEQQKIVTVLQSAERDTRGLKQFKDILKTQKKGLMQQLLTGEIRVKVN